MVDNSSIYKNSRKNHFLLNELVWKQSKTCYKILGNYIVAELFKGHNSYFLANNLDKIFSRSSLINFDNWNLSSEIWRRNILIILYTI